MNYLTHKEIEIGKMYKCESLTYDRKFIIKGPVLVVAKRKRILKLLYNTKLVVIFWGDEKFSTI